MGAILSIRFARNPKHSAPVESHLQKTRVAQPRTFIGQQSDLPPIAKSVNRDQRRERKYDHPDRGPPHSCSCARAKSSHAQIEPISTLSGRSQVAPADRRCPASAPRKSLANPFPLRLCSVRSPAAVPRSGGATRWHSLDRDWHIRARGTNAVAMRLPGRKRFFCCSVPK